MRDRNYHKNLPAVLVFAMSICVFFGCSKIREGSEDHSFHNPHDSHTTSTESIGANTTKTLHVDNHNYTQSQNSDLDRNIDELFNDRCEHNIHTFECDECRYEVGVVKVPKELFDDGLISLSPVKKRVLSNTLTLTGEIQFDERMVTHVSTQVSGLIKKVHVTLGDTVLMGQPLIELESVEVGNARAAFQEAVALETLTSQNYERSRLLRQEGISSEKEVLAAKQELDAARIRVVAARGTLQRIGTGEGKSANSGRLILKAPADGHVLSMHAVRGEVADTSDSLITIGDNRFLWVWADLYEKDYSRVLKSHSVSPLDAIIYVSAFGEEPFAGVLDYISPAMSELSRTIKIRISVPNPKGTLLAGMFTKVNLFIPNDNDEMVLSVPSSSVLEDEGRTFVFVHHQDDYYVRRPINIGVHFGKWVQITQGMTGGAQVVSDGSFLLKSDVLRAKMGAGCAH